MARYGVLSDVHSNLEALESVLERLQAERVDAYVCCGDSVGYGPDPDAVLARLAGLPGLKAVSGNHDLAVLAKMDLDWFNSHARAAVLWTRRVMGERARAFLSSLGPRVEAADFTAVHGSPRSPAEEYLLSTEQFLANTDYFKVSPCFVGHSHLPVYFHGSKDGRVRQGTLRDGQELELGEGPWVLNPGSVGQPRDGDPRASCGVYDAEKKIFKLLRVEYPIQKVQEKIRKAGLPEILAARLSYGE